LIDKSTVWKRVGFSVSILAFSIVLWLTQPFLLFHTVAEFFSIFLAMSLFIIGTQSYRYSKNDVLYFLSLAFFFISVFDGVHTLAYRGMNLIPWATTNMSTQLWIAGRMLQIGTLCIIPLFHRHTFSKGLQEALFIIVSGFIGTLIFTGNFPTCYVDGVGVTAFKKAVEYTIVAVAAIAFVIIGKLEIINSKRVIFYVRCALMALAASELSFTVYKDVYGAMNALGHLLKILSYLFVWIMVVEEGFAKPYDHMFRQIYDNSIRDQLTGLYNRRYYEAVLADELKNTSQLSLVLADINGLKLINDAFGHAEGDQAIVWFALAMKEKGRPTDWMIRIGGDEFMILMPGTSLSEALSVVREIDSGFRSHTIAGITLSASFGCMERTDQGMGWGELLRRAEAQMYRQKLSNTPKVKSHIIERVMQSIFEKAGWERDHSRNVASLSKAIALGMGLAEAQADEIFKAGTLHDIGKVHLDHEILNNRHTLKEAEVYEIQRHTEVGYNILSQVPEYSQLATYVLHHHEHWNGTGYPLGLLREEIPLQSRIISVAEAFDAMTSDRPYRASIGRQAAIDEIRNEAGLKFDPEVARVFIEEVMKQGWHDSKSSKTIIENEGQRSAGMDS